MVRATFADPPSGVGDLLYRFADRLYPLNRSITGQGVRDTLGAIGELIPLITTRVPSGTAVHDWVIPEEWNLREAYIENLAGNRLIDTADSNLHVVGYELLPHLHTLPEHPDWIPYRTTYYQRDWGFCLTQNQLDELTEEKYRVRIDATLETGTLDFAEVVIPGQTNEEFLISTHICHPSLANDNLSGIAIATWAAMWLAQSKPRYTYRILFTPGTIGAIAWMASRSDKMPLIRNGLVLALLGRPGPLHYKRTRKGDGGIDLAAKKVLTELAIPHKLLEFSPWGYDERQYNSPNAGLNVGRLTRCPESAFPEYHTSADNMSLISAEVLQESLLALCKIIATVDADEFYANTKGIGEPQLGKYGLYGPEIRDEYGFPSKMAILWALNMSDGKNSLLDIADQSDLPFDDILAAARCLENAGLLKNSPNQH
jgi:aminopeptidase-like protein